MTLMTGDSGQLDQPKWEKSGKKYNTIFLSRLSFFFHLVFYSMKNSTIYRRFKKLEFPKGIS